MKTAKILKEFREKIDNLYGERIEDVILYGSWARGDASMSISSPLFWGQTKVTVNPSTTAAMAMTGFHSSLKTCIYYAYAPCAQLALV